MPAARPLAPSLRRPRRPKRTKKPRRTPVGPEAGASGPAQVAGFRGQFSRPERQLGLFGSESGADQRQAIPAEREKQKTTCGEEININLEAADHIPENINTKPQPVRYAALRLSPRVVLQAGDKIRVSAGPYHESRDNADGSPVRIKMAERGVMVFEEYCELGARRWIVARGKAGFAALHIGPEELSSEIPGLIRRPYRITKLRPPKTLPQARLPKGAQR